MLSKLADRMGDAAHLKVSVGVPRAFWALAHETVVTQERACPYDRAGSCRRHVGTEQHPMDAVVAAGLAEADHLGGRYALPAAR